MTKTPPKIDNSHPGDRVRITIEKTIQATWRSEAHRPDGAVLLGEFGGWDHFLTPGDEREVVNVEVIEPARPNFEDGDVIQFTAHPESVAVRQGGGWRWTDAPLGRAWEDDRTAEHLASGFYTPIRIAGSAAQS